MVRLFDSFTRKRSFQNLLFQKDNASRGSIYLLAILWKFDMMFSRASSTEGIYKIIRPAIGEALRYFLFIIITFLAQIFYKLFEMHTASWSLSLATRWQPSRYCVSCIWWQCIFVIEPLFYFCREMPLTELKSKYRKVSSIDKVSKGWQDEYDVSSKQVMRKEKLLCRYL